MNSFLKISAALFVLAFVAILSQNGHATNITYLGVAPLILWGVFLLIRAGIGFFKDKRSNNVNSVALLALLTLPLSEKVQASLLLALVFIWVVGRMIATAPAMEYGYRQQKPKWYKHPKFSLLPVLTIKQANEHNTRGFQFDWLFVRLWSLDAFNFEFTIVADTHWGLGFVGILPYLRWTCCIPCPERVSMWAQRNLWRRPKPERFSATDLAPAV
jgi:hypothetical protein